ncbi:pantetheine-phosphate adenylyltransferase [Weissella viridescens]|jgi:pantetheine-phosphate adenylyltransferase|uniref:pantetheine-phosphate adenylyltransferase n=1 Tax=Weissella viridescens TaxID=1629 RepID=UPI001C7D35FE|nr:pantetheine-phosphate adenylyltransferase [Weissella viridescens]MBX4172479.1 pantetheine-phosphate adenylyltransferase [Weissella viridescens]
MTKALFPGSFDPITNGHVDIIERAGNLFDEIIIGVANNTSKTGMFTLAEREALVQASIASKSNVSVVAITGLTADYAQAHEVDTIIRGLRNAQDFSYEEPIAQMNATLSGVETIFMPAKPQNMMLSSSMIKEVAKAGGDISNFVPTPVAEAMQQKLMR